MAFVKNRAAQNRPKAINLKNKFFLPDVTLVVTGIGVSTLKTPNMLEFSNGGIHTDFSVFHRCISVLFLGRKLDRLVVHGPMVQSH